MIRVQRRADKKAVAALAALWRVKPPDQHTLVAVENGTVVGYASWGLTADKHAYGAGVIVHPDWRGKGLGSRLHGARLQAAQQQGATHFVGQTQESNEPMRRILVDWGGMPTVENEDGRAYVNGLSHA